MPLDNMFRSFGSDLAIVLVVGLPLLAVAVQVRVHLATRRAGVEPEARGRATSWLNAVSEAGVVLGLACVAMITLVPSGLPDDGPRDVQWTLFASDLTYGPELTQVLGNLVLFTPVGFFVALRFGRTAGWFACALPTTVEAIQYLTIAGRAATLEDAVLGTLGCAVAVAFGAAGRRIIRGRLTPRPSRSSARPSAGGWASRSPRPLRRLSRCRTRSS